MQLFKSKKQKEIDALDLPFSCKVTNIKHLKKDWRLAITDKNISILLKGDRVVSQFSKVKNFLLAANDMAMVTLEDNRNIIFNSDGDNICIPNKDNCLFPNGFYRLKRECCLALYNSQNTMLANNLRTANVFPNGYYHMSIYNNGDPMSAGVFDPAGNRILFTNVLTVESFPNGWFIAGGLLYDNFGDTVLGMKKGLYPQRWKMLLLARIMPKRKEKSNR